MEWDPGPTQIDLRVKCGEPRRSGGAWPTNKAFAARTPVFHQRFEDGVWAKATAAVAWSCECGERLLTCGSQCGPFGTKTTCHPTGNRFGRILRIALAC